MAPEIYLIRTCPQPVCESVLRDLDLHLALLLIDSRKPLLEGMRDSALEIVAS
jgi:hypothetical protein